MFISPSSNSLFDIPFLVIEGMGLVFWIWHTFSSLSVPLWLTGILALFLIVLLPSLWWLLYPPANGIDGAGRLFLTGGALGLQLLAFAIVLYQHVSRSGPPS